MYTFICILFCFLLVVLLFYFILFFYFLFFFFFFFFFFLARFIVVVFVVSICLVCNFSIVATCPSIQLPALLFVCVLFLLFVDVLSGKPKQN